MDFRTGSFCNVVSVNGHEVRRALVFGAIDGSIRWQRTKDYPVDAPIEEITKYLHAMHHEAMRYFTLELGK